MVDGAIGDAAAHGPSAELANRIVAPGERENHHAPAFSTNVDRRRAFQESLRHEHPGFPNHRFHREDRPFFLMGWSIA